jgi:hypothetical protein
VWLQTVSLSSSSEISMLPSALGSPCGNHPQGYQVFIRHGSNRPKVC